jgi:hypothetical protein
MAAGLTEVEPSQPGQQYSGIHDGRWHPTPAVDVRARSHGSWSSTGRPLGLSPSGRRWQPRFAMSFGMASSRCRWA